MADWTLESNIRGCPCCLATTQGVSLCTQARGKAAARRTGLPAVPAHYRLLGHGQGTSDRGSILKRWQRVVLPPGSTEQCGQCGHAHPAAAGCLQMDHDCLWNVSSRKPYCDCSVTGTAGWRLLRNGWASALHTVPRHRRPLLVPVLCTWSDCWPSDNG